jgi:hypothetical protein
MWPRARKALVAALGAVASLVSLGVLPSPYQEIALAVLAVATAAGVYAIPNTLTRRQETTLRQELADQGAPPAPVREAIIATREKL